MLGGPFLQMYYTTIILNDLLNFLAVPHTAALQQIEQIIKTTSEITLNL